MKKSILVLVLLLLVVSGAFAQNFMGIGGGVLFDASFNNGIDWVEDGLDHCQSLRNISFGGFVFFDVRFAEVSINFSHGMLTAVYDISGETGHGEVDHSEYKRAGNVMQLGFSLLGKLPIELGEITLFPLLGISYNRVLSWNDPRNMLQTGNVGNYLSQFGFQGGVGFDYNINDNLFLRTSALFQIRLPMEMYREKASIANNVKTTLGYGPVIRLALGYRL